MESTELKTVLEDNGLSLEDKKRVLDENKVEYHEENGRIILNVPEEKKNLLACMNVIVKKTTVNSSGDEDEKIFNENVFDDAKEPIAFVAGTLGLTPMQAVLFSTLMEHNHRRGVDMVDYAEELGMSRVSLYS